ncbi:MAG: DUF432 domain-containing protein [Opitutales bacterium]
MNTDTIATFWRTKIIRPNHCVSWEMGPLRMWLQRWGSEWRLAFEHREESDDVYFFSPAAEPPPELQWSRWALKKEVAAAEIVPVMQDRPLVIRPETPLNIPPGNDVIFFVSVPVWLKVFIGTSRERLLAEVPTMILSNTWFGEPTEGELCYALRTGASRDLDGVKKGRYRAVCPVLIKNHSPDELDFQKICLRIQHVHVYEGENRLWTNQVTVSYLGKNNFSAIEFKPAAPDYERILRQVGDAREPIHISFIKKSFGNLMSLQF